MLLRTITHFSKAQDVFRNIQPEYLMKIRSFFDEIGKELNVLKPQDWYHVRATDIRNFENGNEVLNVFSNSHVKALQTIYPEYDLKSWRFSHVPNSYWEKGENRRNYLTEIGKELGFKKHEDWYNVNYHQLKEYRLSGILKYHKTILNAIVQLFPEHDWKLFRFQNLSIPDGYWKKKENRLDFIEHLHKVFSIKEMQDWYKVGYNDVVRQGGISLLLLYDNSLINVLKEFYPDYDWIVRKARENVHPYGHWNSLNNQKIEFDRLWKKFNIKKLEEWYAVRWSDLLPYPALSIVSSKYNGSLRRALTTIYPDLPWAPEELWGRGSSRKSQLKLFQTLKEYFPSEEVFCDFIFEDTRFEGEFRRQIEVDVFVPSQNLAFEYHGRHHYKENEYFGELGMREQLDREKRSLCEFKGITLVEVPFYWDGEDESLLNIIKKYRPNFKIGK